MKILSRRGEVGWALGLCWVVATFVGASAGWFLSSIDPTEEYLSLDSEFLIPNSVLAGIVAAQWLVLRWWFSRSVWWVMATVLGLILFGLLVTWASNVFMIAVIGAVLGFWQRQRVGQVVSHLVHRQRGGWTLLWVVISAVGFSVQVSVQLGLGIGVWLLEGGESPSGFGFIAVTALGFLSFGIVTGTALIWLLRRPLPEE